MIWRKIEECVPVKKNMYEVIYEDMVSGYVWFSEGLTTHSRLRDNNGCAMTDKKAVYWLDENDKKQESKLVLQD